MLAPWKESYDQPRQHVKKQRHYFAHKGPSSQSYGFSSSHVWMWELDYKKIWVLKNWCFWTVMLEKTLECPLDWKEIQLVHPKGNQSWISLEGLMLKLKLQYFSHLMRRTDSLEKILMLGKIEGRKRRGRQRMRWLDGITNSMEWVWVSSGSWWWTGRPGVLRFMGSQRVGHDWMTEMDYLGSNPVSLFALKSGRWLLFASNPRTPAPTYHPITVLGALIHIWKSGIADGCDISHLLIWQEIFHFTVRRKSLFPSKTLFNHFDAWNSFFSSEA